MRGKLRGFLLLTMGLVSLMPAKVLAADPSYEASTGAAAVMQSYYEAVEDGRRRLYHNRTNSDILDEAREAALETYDNMGIVDIDSGYLNVRKKPSEEGNIIGKMLDGYAGEILGEKGDWYHISSGSVEGWVNKEFVRTGDQARKKARKAMELRVQITTETLNVRTKPDDDAPMWTQVNELERYPVLKDLGDWIEIELDTSTGYVSSEYVEVRYCLDKAIEVEEIIVGSDSDRNRQFLVDEAMKYLGNPYVWGGESLTHGCDCSGYVMLLYRMVGINLPHYSGDQATYGRRIKSNEMRKGDLIFYADSNGTINHVTMYIGGGKIIGAQSRRAGITIKTWNYRTPVKIISLLD